MHTCIAIPISRIVVIHIDTYLYYHYSMQVFGEGCLHIIIR